MRFITISVIVCAFLYVEITAGALSLDFEKCHLNDDACFTRTLAYILTTYPKTGIRALNVIPFDPLHVRSLKIDRDPKKSISVALSFKDVDITGLQHTQVEKVEGFASDFKNLILRGFVPKTTIKGPYQVDGTVLGLPINGKGIAEIHLEKIHFVSKLAGKKVIRGNAEFVEITDASIELSDPGSVNFNLDGLFDGNKELSDTANAFLNQNSKEIFSALKGGLVESFALIFKIISKGVFDKYAYNELLLTN